VTAHLQSLKHYFLPDKTLRTKIALLLTATICTLLLIATVVRATQDRQSFLAEQTEKGIFIATTMADLIASDGGVEDPAHVALQVKEFAKTSGVVSIRVVDRTFTLIAASRLGTVGRTYRDPDVIEATKHGTTATRIRGRVLPSALEVITPIREKGRLVGALEIGLDLTGNLTDLATFVRRGLLVAMVVGGATTLLLLWSLTLLIVRPVTRVAKLSADLARGDFAVEFPTDGADEITQLSRALTKTRDSLRELSLLWKDQNPLSGLPGNLAIDRELRRRLQENIPFAVLYADLDNFKAFNDRYGFDRGNHILRFTAKILEDALKTQGENRDFLGHVGGDDFILLVNPGGTERIAKEAIRVFDAGVQTFYDEADGQAGYITTHDRQGRSARVPLTGLTVVGILIRGSHLSVLDIGEAAAHLKAYAKRTLGSKFVMDHRVPGRELERWP